MDDFCEWLNDLMNVWNDVDTWANINRPLKIEPLLFGGFCVSLISRILIPGPLGWVPLFICIALVWRLSPTDDN